MLDPTETPLESRLFEKAALAKGGFLDAVSFRAIVFVILITDLLDLPGLVSTWLDVPWFSIC